MNLFNYKWAMGLLAIAVVIGGLNFMVYGIRSDNEARQTMTWEGDCLTSELVKAGDGIALSAVCGDFNITSANPDAMIFHEKNPGGTIHCKLYKAGNNDCRPVEPEGSG